MRAETTIQHEGEHFGTVSVKGLSGRQSLVGATLVFNCEIAIRPMKSGWLTIDGMVGRVGVDRGGDLGPAWLLNSFRVRAGMNDSSPFTVCVAASPAAIRAIDRLRTSHHSEDVSFILWLQMTGASQGGPVNCQAVLNHATVTASEWFRVLKEASFEVRHIIDVPVDGERMNGGPLKTAAEHYRRAIVQWTKGSHVQVLGECRKVMEALRDDLGLKPGGVAEWNPTEKTAWSLTDRIEYARAAVYEILHLAAHSGSSNDPRAAESDLALGLVGSILRYYADRR
jgi:hypothetical protein